MKILISLLLSSLFVVALTSALTGDQCEDLAPADCKPLDLCNIAGSIQAFFHNQIIIKKQFTLEKQKKLLGLILFLVFNLIE
jgi:hypothetical protein